MKSYQRFALALLLLAPSPLVLQAREGGLRVVIAEGEGANNNSIHSSASRLLVRVVDAAGPVEGALVVFTAPEGGPTVTFSGSGQTGQAVSDASGFALSPRLAPLKENGPVEIRVMATKGGEFANAVVHQMNLGLNEQSLRDAQLNVLQLDVAGDTGTPVADPLQLHLRVEDAAGRPVSAATVSLVLHSIDRAGKRQELWRTTMTSDEHGEARCSVVRPKGKLRFEFAAEVEQGGRRATRFFDAK